MGLNTVVWMDNSRAFIYGLDQDGVHQTATCLELNQEQSPQVLADFFHQVALLASPSPKLLLMGPGKVRDEFSDFCRYHHPQLVGRIVASTETGPKARRDEILASTRAYFYSVYAEPMKNEHRPWRLRSLHAWFSTLLS
jgi:stalled ribosome rescue protein Dom34